MMAFERQERHRIIAEKRALETECDRLREVAQRWLKEYVKKNNEEVLVRAERDHLHDLLAELVACKYVVCDTHHEEHIEKYRTALASAQAELSKLDRR